MKKAEHRVLLPTLFVATVIAIGGAGWAARAASTHSVVAAAALPTAVPQLAMPTVDVLIVLIRSSLDALNQANATNNYSVLSALGSDIFANNYPPSRLAVTFEPLRRNGVSLAASLITAPQLDQPAKIENGTLILIGHFDTKPQIIRYNLLLQPSRGAWRIAGINVSLSPAVQATK